MSKKYVSNFNANIQNLRIDGNIKTNKEISNLLEKTINLIKIHPNDWLKNFDEMMKRFKVYLTILLYYFWKSKSW